MIKSSAPCLFYLYLERLKDQSQHRCKLVATSLDEAIRTARATFGPVKLISSGCRDLALGHECLGPEQYIPSRYDRLLEPRTIGALRQ